MGRTCQTTTPLHAGGVVTMPLLHSSSSRQDIPLPTQGIRYSQTPPWSRSPSRAWSKYPVLKHTLTDRTCHAILLPSLTYTTPFHIRLRVFTDRQLNPSPSAVGASIKETILHVAETTRIVGEVQEKQPGSQIGEIRSIPCSQISAADPVRTH